MIGISAASSSTWVNAIGWMLLHSLWQGAAVAMSLALVLRVLRRAPAQARYLWACIAMSLLVALPAASLRRPESTPSVIPGTHSPGTDPLKLGGGPTPGLNRTPSTRSEEIRFVDRIQPILPAIVGLWMAGAGVLSLRLLGGWILSRRWARRDTRPLVGHWIDRLDRLKERMGIRRIVILLESSHVEVPMIVGCIRPAVLVPVAVLSGLTAPELETILAHELAHIRRHDYFVNVLQCVVEILVFYHPATWWIARVIRHERELCCDDIAVAACRDRMTYVRALAAMEGLRVPAFSPSPAANGGILLARVRHILEPQDESMKPARVLLGLAVVLAVVPIWLARAGDRPTETDPRPAPSKGYFYPSRSFGDVVTNVNEAPTGRFMLGVCPDPVVDIMHVEPEPASFPTVPQDVKPIARGVVVVGSVESDSWDNPPSDAEVRAKLPKETDHQAARFYRAEKNNVRIVTEKIGDKVDPVKIYPLAGPCQLVHKHYKCTVYYDESYTSDYPIPFKHVDHKVEVVYIDKDYLRRAPSTVQPAEAPDERLDRIGREIEQLKRKRQLDRQEQERTIDRLIKELEDLKSHDLDAIDETWAARTSR